MYPMNQWPGGAPPNYGGYQAPQFTGGFMQPQPTSMSGMAPGFSSGTQGQASFVARPPAPPPPPMGGGMPSQMTGMPPQMTGMPPQMTGMPPQMTGMPPQMGMSPMLSQPTGASSPMMPQTTGMMPQMTGVLNDPRMRLMYTQFLPAAQPYSGAPAPSSMNFHQASLQPAQFQSKLQTLTAQPAGSSAAPKPKIPWTLSKEEKKSYDNIFRAWDAKRTGFISGDVARELFGQSGLEREKLLQIWHLADTENRGKLNLAEFHVAMALIYRALNGNEVPNELPPELVPTSSRDLSESVDFLKDLLKQDTSVRSATALNLPNPGSNKDTKYAETRSFYRNPVEREPETRQSDAVAYKHTDSDSAGYRSRSRYLDRRQVRFDGQSAAEDLGEMRRQLERTQRMLDNTQLNDEEERELDREMEDVRYSIRRLQDDIEYYNRREGAHAGEQRRKAERTLMQLLHERLPALEKRLERRQTASHERRVEESRQRDARNNDTHAHLREKEAAPPKPETPRAETPRAETPRAETPSAATSSPSLGSAPAAAPPPKLTGAERDAWIRSEAQRRVQERMRLLGVGGRAGADASPSVDVSVEERLQAEKREAEARAAQADREASEREEARRARMREQKAGRAPPPDERAAAPKEEPAHAPAPEAPSAPPTHAEPPARAAPPPRAPAPRTAPAAPPRAPPRTAPPPKTAPPRAPPADDQDDEWGPAPVPPARAPSAAAPPPPAAPAAPPAPAPATPAQEPAEPRSTNPFFRMQKAEEPEAPAPPPAAPQPRAPQPSSSLPPAQRAQAAPASRPSGGIHLAPSNDDDWDEEEDDEEEGPGLSSPPSAPKAPSAPLGGSAGPADRNALLSQIRGGQSLRKATTRDRSGAPGAGTVLGSASPPRGLATASVPDAESSDEEAAPESLEPTEAPPVPGGFEEPVRDAPEEAAAQAASAGVDPDLGFDTTRSFHVRSIYPFVGDEVETLTFEANQIFQVHPTLTGADIEGDWTWGAWLAVPERKGLIPAAYVVPMEQTVAAKALYDYEAGSDEEASLAEGETLAIVDQSDADWWLIARGAHCLMVPSNYVEVVP
ncbi:hypothetical protein MOBT1_001202 [Malassezia obtusa]|uniref:Actin cytoskeleton-regulatory complex protein PAN1 n=1 Tax=Malassezia obtusa TaxID=76774 RepID=A0AAF0E0R7_9BASI|nr:hypothetical protein MOBT1_001202 [Malassezia obtusa]